MGALDFLFGPAFKKLNEPIPSAIKKEAPKKAEEAPKTQVKMSRITPSGNEEIVVTKPIPRPEPAPLEIGPIAAGNQGPPMNIDDVLAVLARLGGGQKGANALPPVPEFNPTPTNIGEIPIDLRPIAAWLDSNYGTKYAQSTANAPENYLQMAAKYKELASGGQAVEQARAMAQLDRYKAQLKALAGSGMDDKLIRAITGGRGITAGVTGGATSGIEGGPTTGTGTVPAAVGGAASGQVPLPAAQALAQAKARKDIEDSRREARFQTQKAAQDAGVSTVKEAMQDKLIRKYTDNVVPATTTLRNALLNDPKNDPGGEATILAIQAFQQTIEPALAVHQSDIQNYKEAQGISGRIEGFLNSLKGGSPLSPKARQDMLKLASDMQNIWRESAYKKLDTYKRIGAMQGVEPKTVDTAVGKELSPTMIQMEVIDPKTKIPKVYRIPNNIREQFIRDHVAQGLQVKDLKGSH